MHLGMAEVTSDVKTDMSAEGWSPGLSLATWQGKSPARLSPGTCQFRVSQVLVPTGLSSEASSCLLRGPHSHSATHTVLIPVTGTKYFLCPAARPTI